MKKKNQHRIFLVDDHPDNLQLLEGILESGPYRVSAFPSARQALAAARSHPPDLFLLDVMMPEMDGFELCRHLQEDAVLRDRPVIFVSALHDVDSKSKSFQLGGVDYMTKPFLAEEVRARVATHLRIYAQKNELAEAYAKVCDLERAREDFVQMLVHDLRSPLTGISMALQTLQMEIKDDLLHQLVEQSLFSLDQLKLMVNTLLDYGRLEAESMPLRLGMTPLARIVNELRVSLPLAGCHLEIPNELEAFCDPLLTQRILQNLLTNALKYSDPADVSLTVHRESKVVNVRVSDKGYGISPEDQENLFKKFGQGPDARGGGGNGYGIGLAFCKLAVEAQGGEIGLVSAPGAGSTFWFTLPMEGLSPEDAAV